MKNHNIMIKLAIFIVTISLLMSMVTFPVIAAEDVTTYYLQNSKVMDTDGNWVTHSGAYDPKWEHFQHKIATLRGSDLVL